MEIFKSCEFYLDLFLVFMGKRLKQSFREEKIRQTQVSE